MIYFIITKYENDIVDIIPSTASTLGLSKIRVMESIQNRQAYVLHWCAAFEVIVFSFLEKGIQDEISGVKTDLLLTGLFFFITVIGINLMVNLFLLLKYIFFTYIA